MAQERTVLYKGSAICYVLEEKAVKNLNLRIHKDCKVYVSASPDIPVEKVDDFVISKGNYIRSAQGKFLEMAQYVLQPRQYVSGETFYLLGRGVRLKVEKNAKEAIFADGIYLYLCIKDPDDFSKKQRMVTRYLDEQCQTILGEIISETYPVFQKYGVSMPVLRIRNMETRWGSCLTKKGIITLNRRLLEVPRNCIEYVVIHEFCHFGQPNHSTRFYDFLTILMPDWRERKKTLDKSAVYWI